MFGSFSTRRGVVGAPFYASLQPTHTHTPLHGEQANERLHLVLSVEEVDPDTLPGFHCVTRLSVRPWWGGVGGEMVLYHNST